MDIESFGAGIILKWTPSDIDKQFAQIQKYIDTKKLNIKFNVDSKEIENIASKVNALSKQINNIPKTSNVPILNDKEITDKIQRINNSLDRLKVNKDKVFEDARVSSEVLKLNSMVDQFRKGEVSSKDLSLQMDNLRTSVSKVSGEFKNVNHDGYAFSQMTELALKKILVWGISTQAIYGTLNMIRASIDTIRNMESQMTSIARVMDDVNFKMETYRDNLLDIAKQTGSTFTDSADVALRFAQAGYNVVDSLQLTKTAMAAVQTAELDAKNATESMIGIMSQWNMQASEMPLLLDKINRISDEYTVTSQDLVDGLLRSSSASRNLGLSIDETISLLTVLRESSGRTGREVGNALNSILSYATRGKTVDILEASGIQVFTDKSKTQFRNYMDVFRDISTQWNGLSAEIQNGFIQSADEAGLFNEELSQTLGLEQEWSDVQKRDVSNATAGVYRRNYFLGLMNSMSKTKDVLEDLQGAEGYTFAELEKRTETLDSRINVLNDSLKELVTVFSDDGGLVSLKGLVSVANGLVNTITFLADKIGGLNLVIATIVGGTTLLSKGFRDFSGALSNSIPGLNNIIGYLQQVKTEKSNLIKKQSEYIVSLREEIATGTLGNIAREKGIASMRGLNAELSVAQISLTKLRLVEIATTVSTIALQTAMTMGLSLAITAVISGVTKLADKLITTKQEQKEYFASLLSSVQQLTKETSQIPSLISQYEQLSAKTLKTTEEKQKLAEVQQKLTELFPNAISGYDSEGNAILGNIELIKQLNEEKKKELEQKQQSLSDQFRTTGNSSFSTLQKDQQDLDKLLTKRQETLNKINNIKSNGVTSVEDDYLTSYNTELTNLDKKISELQPKVQQQRTDLLNMANAFIQASGSAEKLDKGSLSQFIYSLSQSKDKISDFYDKLDALGKSDFSSKLADAKKQFDDLAKTDPGKASEKYANEILPALIIEMDKVGINGTAAKEILDKMFVLPNADQAKEKIEQITFSTKDLVNAYKETSSEVEAYNDILEKNANGYQWTGEEVADLIEKYPALTEAVDIQNGALSIESDIVETLRQAIITEKNDKIDAEIEKTNITLEQTQKRLEALKAERDANSANFDSMVASGAMTSNEAANRKSGNLIYENSLSNNVQQYLDKIKNLKKFQSVLNDPSFGSKSSSSKSPSSSPSSSTAQQPSYADPTDATIRAVNAENQLTHAINESIKSYLDKYKSTENYNAQLKYTTELISSQSKELQQLEEANTSLKQKMSGLNQSWVDLNGELTTTYYDQYNSASKSTQEAMQAQADKLQKLTKAVRENESSIDSLKNANYELKQSLIDLSQSLATEVLNAQKSLDERTLKSHERELESFKNLHQAKINGLEAEIDALEEKNEVESEQEERAKRLLDIQNAQNKLNNILKERNTRIYVAGQGWTWAANPNEVKSAQDELQRLQTDYQDWERQNTINHQKQILQDEIKAEQDLINQKQKWYDDLQQQFNTEWENIDAMSQALLDQFGDNVEQAASVLMAKLASLNAQLASMTTVTLPDGLNNITASNSSVSTNKSGKVDVVASGVDADILRAQYGDSINIVEGQGLAGQAGTDRTDTNKMYQDVLDKLGIDPKNTVDMWKYAEGGETNSTGLHWLDGVKGKPERVLSAEQTEAFNSLVKDIKPVSTILRNFMTNFKIPNIIPNTSGGSQVFNISKLEFPNVTSSSEIQDAILNLPRIALQYKGR